MSDIDFLANKKQADGQDAKNPGNKKEEIVWSEPKENTPPPKGNGFSALPFFSTKKEVKEPIVPPKPAIDKNKIKESRQEILKLIKRDETLAAEEKSKTGKNLLASLTDRLKKQTGSKEILIDYQQAFNQEKTKRNLPKAEPIKIGETAKFKNGFPKIVKKGKDEAGPPVNFSGRIKPPLIPPAKERKPEVIRPKLKPGEGWWSKFLNLFKNNKPVPKLPAALSLRIKNEGVQLNRPALKPVEAGLTKIVKEIKPETAAAPRPQPIIEEKRKIKAKEEPLKQTDPIQFNKNAPKVLETNLIRGEIITFFDWRKKIISLISGILIPSFLVGLIYLGFVYYQKQAQAEINGQTDKFNELTGRIRQEEIGAKEAAAFQARLIVVSQIFAQHIYWTNFFNFLEDNTIKEVYYNGFSGDTGGVYQLSSVATGFSDISEQVEVLKSSQKIISVKTAGGVSAPDDTKNKGGVKFNLDLAIPKSIFTE